MMKVIHVYSVEIYRFLMIDMDCFVPI